MAVNGKVKESMPKKELGKGIFGFFREVKAEVKRITWPSKEDTKKAILAVIVFVVISIILIGGFDFIFRNLLDFVFKIKK